MILHFFIKYIGTVYVYVQYMFQATASYGNYEKSSLEAYAPFKTCE